MTDCGDIAPLTSRTGGKTTRAYTPSSTAVGKHAFGQSCNESPHVPPTSVVFASPESEVFTAGI